MYLFNLKAFSGFDIVYFGVMKRWRWYSHKRSYDRVVKFI